MALAFSVVIHESVVSRDFTTQSSVYCETFFREKLLLLGWGLVKGAARVISRKSEEEHGCCPLFISVADTGVDQKKGLAELWEGLQCKDLPVILHPTPLGVTRSAPTTPLTRSLLTKLFCAEEGWPKAFDVNEERRSG